MLLWENTASLHYNNTAEYHSIVLHYGIQLHQGIISDTVSQTTAKLDYYATRHHIHHNNTSNYWYTILLHCMKPLQEIVITVRQIKAKLSNIMSEILQFSITEIRQYTAEMLMYTLMRTFKHLPSVKFPQTEQLPQIYLNLSCLSYAYSKKYVVLNYSNTSIHCRKTYTL